MKFIHFGCWNQGRCDLNEELPIEKLIPLTRNIKHIMDNDFFGNDNDNFIIVAGDNYYPKKVNSDDGLKKKYFSHDDFNSGFKCLQELSTEKKVPIYLVMGNHDLQYEEDLYKMDKGVVLKNTDKYSVLDVGDVPSKIDKCTIMQEEKNIIEKESFLSTNMSHVSKDGKTLILFMNSIFYSDDKDEMIECFKHYRNYDDVDMDDLDSLREKEESLLRDILDEEIKKGILSNLIVVAHDPILSRRTKIKNNKVKEIKKPLSEEGLIFLHSLYSIGGASKNYYLCADVHQYQDCDITLSKNGEEVNIKQFVVGTGGTELDEKCTTPKPNEELENMNVDGDVQILFRLNDCKNSFGYLTCEDNKDNNQLTFNFEEVMPVPQNGGNYRKYKKTNKKQKKKLNKKSKKRNKKGKNITKRRSIIKNNKRKIKNTIKRLRFLV
jgi:hypothetical protein